MTVDAPSASSPRISILVSDLETGSGTLGSGTNVFIGAALERLGAKVTICGFIFGDDPGEPTVGDFPMVTVPGRFILALLGDRESYSGNWIRILSMPYVRSQQPWDWHCGINARLAVRLSWILMIGS